MVEAVVVLPVFIVIFVSLLYARDQVLARQQANTLARSCAWQYSMNNCSHKPPECSAVLAGPILSGMKHPDLEDALTTGAADALSNADASDLVGAAVGAILGPAFEAVLGRSVTATARRKVERPALYGGDVKTVQGSYELPCNLAPTTAPEVAKDAWSRFF